MRTDRCQCLLSLINPLVYLGLKMSQSACPSLPNIFRRAASAKTSFVSQHRHGSLASQCQQQQVQDRAANGLSESFTVPGENTPTRAFSSSGN